jgi:hypothetical protein
MKRTEDEHLAMMRDPRRWPHLILPLVKRQTHPYDDQAVGILWSPITAEATKEQKAKATKWSFLRGQNMLMPVPENAQWEEGGDELLARLIKEGWEVD